MIFVCAKFGNNLIILDEIIPAVINVGCESLVMFNTSVQVHDLHRIYHSGFSDNIMQLDKHSQTTFIVTKRLRRGNKIVC